MAEAAAVARAVLEEISQVVKTAQPGAEEPMGYGKLCSYYTKTERDLLPAQA